jgi:hypothetical protein
MVEKISPRWRANAQNADTGGTHNSYVNFSMKLCLPMATGLQSGGSGDFGTSPFLGSSSDKPLACPYVVTSGRRR